MAYSSLDKSTMHSQVCTFRSAPTTDLASGYRTGPDGAEFVACRPQMCEMLGIRGWWTVNHNQTELSRRAGEDIPALRRLDVIAALLRLPLNTPVVETDVRRSDLRLLAGLPPLIISRADGVVVRWASPPLQISHVLVPSRAFRLGLEAASHFSTYCARSMLLPSEVAVCELQLAEANYYGVGVYTADAARMTELVAPDPLDDWPETPASWAFSERLHGQLDVSSAGSRVGPAAG